MSSIVCQLQSSCEDRQAHLSPRIYLKHILFWQVLADVMRYIELLVLVWQCFCQSLWGPCDLISAAPLHHSENLRASSHVIECDRAAVCRHSLLAHCVFGHRGLVAAWVGAGRLCCTAWLSFPSPPTCVFPARSGASQNKQGEINTCSGQLSAG